MGKGFFPRFPFTSSPFLIYLRSITSPGFCQCFCGQCLSRFIRGGWDRSYLYSYHYQYPFLYFYPTASINPYPYTHDYQNTDDYANPHNYTNLYNNANSFDDFDPHNYSYAYPHIYPQTNCYTHTGYS